MASKTKIYTIKLNDKTTYGWTGREATYKGLENDLGITVNDPGKSVPEGVVFGGKVKPPRINIRTTSGKSYVRFINPDKIDEMVYDEENNGNGNNGNGNNGTSGNNDLITFGNLLL